MKTPFHTTSKDVYQIITDQIISQLQQGCVPWKKPWHNQGTACNYVSGKAYRGINALLLNGNRVEQPYYLTFKQASELGGRVKKGAKSHLVTYWNYWYTDKENGSKIQPQQVKGLPAGKVKKTAFLKYYHVFNVADIEGVNFHFPQVYQRAQPQKLAFCEQVVEAIPNAPRIRFGGSQAFYSPKSDTVQMPLIEYFQKAEYYYSVLFHELAHSTGHPTRLARKQEGQINPFGSEDYSKEELVAELSACFMCGFVGIEQQTLENSAAYIQNWLEVLHNDKRLLIEAAGKAQAAVDYLLNIKTGQVEEDCSEAA